MRIVLISLESQTARREFQAAQLAKLGLACEVFDAITPETLPAQYLAIDRDNWERTVTLAEMSCLASHRSVWTSVASGREPVLILEDDAVLVSALAGFLSGLADVPGLEHVTLEVRKRKKLISGRPVRQLKQASLHRLFQDRSGAAAYVLWPEGARKLLSASEGMAVLADAVICSCYSLRSYQAVPGLAMQSDQCGLYGFQSPLETWSTLVRPRGPKAAKTFLQSLRRLRSQLKLGLRFWTVAAGARRRQIPVDLQMF